MHDVELAKRFDADVVARYGTIFSEALSAKVTAHGEAREILDLACGTGYGLLRLLPAVSFHARITALDDDRFRLNCLHAKLTPDSRRRVFIQKHSGPRLPFAADTFDVVYGAFPLGAPANPRRFLQQALRVLRDNAWLYLAVPLENSFVELTHALSDGLRADNRKKELERALAARGPMLSPAEWTTYLERVGAINGDCSEHQFDIDLQTPFSADRLFTAHLIHLWFGDAPRETADIFARLAETVKTATLRLGIIAAQRGALPIEEGTSA